MSLYPSLEDMEAHKMIQSQTQLLDQMKTPYDLHPPQSGSYGALQSSQGFKGSSSGLYPSMNDFMGLDITPEMLASNNVVAVKHGSGAVAMSSTSVSTASHGMVAPLSGQSLGLQRGMVTQGIREMVLCKGSNGKVGLRCQAISKGIFVSLVESGSPAALGSLRFGDQILQVNDITVAGFSMDKVHDLFKKANTNGIRLVVRDRPFERSVTLHKDSVGHIGFIIKNGQITSLVKDSSAARNGLLIDHNVLEVNGQNVVGMKDKEVSRILEGAGHSITVTIMPTFLYEHMIKNMSGSLLKKAMDHSVPDL